MLFSSVEFSIVNNLFYISVSNLYKSLSLLEIPTTFQEEMVLSYFNKTRYSYQFSRTLNKLFCIIKTPLGLILRPFFSKWINETEVFHY